MDVLEAIKGRRSVRRYQPRGVDDATIATLIDCARFAPSAHNSQRWEFIVTRDREKRVALAQRRYSRHLSEAPVAIVVCAKYVGTGGTPGARLREMFHVQDSAAAIQNLLLAAHALGLGACWIGDFDAEQVKTMFAIPAPFAPVAIISVGYPAEQRQAPARRPVADILHWEKF